jgi:hypothetical protein
MTGGVTDRAFGGVTGRAFGGVTGLPVEVHPAYPLRSLSRTRGVRA